jgi:hypothetical protein
MRFSVYHVDRSLHPIRDFPENTYLALSAHAIQTVQLNIVMPGHVGVKWLLYHVL